MSISTGRAIWLGFGVILLAVLFFALGAVLMYGGATPEQVTPVAAAPAQGGGQAPAQAQDGDTGADGPFAAQKRLAGARYNSLVEYAKIKGGDEAADMAVDPLLEASSPALSGATSGLQTVLPPFLGKHVPWLAGYGRHVAVGTAKENLGNRVEDVIEGGAKGEFLPGNDDGAGASAGAAGAARPAGVPATATAATGAAQAAGAVASGQATPSGAAQAVMASLSGGGAATQGGGSGFVPPALPGTRWTVELGHFATARHAETFAADMQRRGIPARVASGEDDGRRQWYAVRTRSYQSHATAEAELNWLLDRGYSGVVVADGAR